jgi:transcriptional regulator with XRE-family HTH domain
MKIGKMLRIYRASTGKDQKTTADEIGIGVSSYARLESGKSIDMPNFIRLLAWLFDDTDQTKENAQCRLPLRSAGSAE